MDQVTEPGNGAPWVINGKRYTLWPKFVVQKEQWIGGTLRDVSNEFGKGHAPDTLIEDITFEPNGTDSAMLTIHGQDYDCGSDVRYLAVEPSIGVNLGKGWIGFSSLFGLRFAIKAKAQDVQRCLTE